MSDASGRNVEMLYDLLLPNDLGVIVNLHWDEQPILRGLRDRHADLVSFRLEDHVFSGGAGNGREGRKRRGFGTGELPLPAGSAGCIVLHHILDAPPVAGLSRAACRRELMRLCKRILAPGGVLAISCRNRWSVERLRGFLSAQPPLFPPGMFRSGLSLWGCRRLLHRAGFKVSEAFAIVPSLESPAAIVSTRREAAQAFYGRGVPQTPHWTVLLVRLLNALNVRSYLEPTFVVLARHD